MTNDPPDRRYAPPMPEAAIGPLGRWYAKPQSAQEAARLLDRAEQRLRSAARRGVSCITCRLAIMIAHFWLGQSIETDYQSLLSMRPGSAHARVFVSLIHGQLLMSRQLSGAMEQLDSAFEQATALFHPDDYFLVWKRHQILRSLPLSTTPHPAEPLPELLRLALVIERLKGTGRRPYTHDRNDTYG